MNRVEQMLAEPSRIEAALSRAAGLAVLTHARLDRSVPVARNGSVEHVPPQEIIARFGSAEVKFPPGPATT